MLTNYYFGGQNLKYATLAERSQCSLLGFLNYFLIKYVDDYFFKMDYKVVSKNVDTKKLSSQ